jgi:hypothetical protein
MRRAVGALAIAALMWAGAATNAAAGGANGLLVSSVDFNCYSIATGNPYLEPMISAIAGWGSTGEMPVAGEVFSAQFSVGLVGRSCSGASISPTVIPPLGVRIAVDAQHPVQWRYPGQSETWQTSGVRLLTLPDGSAKLVPEANENSLWPIANDQPPLQFLVPLVADRQLSGAGSGPGQCPNGPPCARGDAGDYLQVQVDSSIGTPLTLTPVVALFASPAPAGAPTGGAAAGKVKVAKTLTAKALTRGLTVNVPASALAEVTLTLTAKGKVVAKGTATAAKAGTLSVKLKRTAALKRIKGTAKATLKVVATGPGLTKTTQSLKTQVRG